MDFKKIFLKEAVPTAIGGQAIMEGVMMRSEEKTAVAMRLSEDRIYIKVTNNKPAGKASKLPFIRGVVNFVASLVNSVKVVMDSADVLEKYEFFDDDEEEMSGFEKKISEKYGEDALWNVLLIGTVIVAMLIAVVAFAVVPTVLAALLGYFTDNTILLNLAETFIRLLVFVGYVWVIGFMPDIYRLFQYHGAEHKTIHCFENGKELTPENAAEFYTLHPRCGTSFVMFVVIVGLVLFAFLGWPGVLLRIISRILLLPVIAAVSYELLKWAGRSDNILIRVLSYPGLMLQKLTTREPDRDQLEVAIISLKAVLDEGKQVPYEVILNAAGELVEDIGGETSGEFAAKKEAEDGCGVEETKQEFEIASTKRDPESLWPDVVAPRYSNNRATVGNTLRWGQNCLSMIENGKNDAKDIFCYATGFSYPELITRKNEIMRGEDIEEYERLIEKRLEGTPLQYITKVQMFMGLPFRVNESVLIPRLDTEILVEQAEAILEEKNYEEPYVLDLCTGSGAIGISIAHRFENAEVVLADVSPEALKVARDNAKLNGVLDRCLFVESDLFLDVPDKRFDMIVSNPPYIKSSEISELSREIREHEPLQALDGGEDGLDFYRRIIINAGRYLGPGGILAFEIGYDQGIAVSGLIKLTDQYRNVVVIQDLAGLDRVVVAERG